MAAPLCLASFALTTGSCVLAHDPLPILPPYVLSARVQPEVACPGDRATVRWENTGGFGCTGAGCERANTIELEPAALFTGVPTNERSGSRDFTVAATTTVTVRARQQTVNTSRPVTLNEQTRTATVRVPAPALTETTRAPGACLDTPAGRVPGWNPNPLVIERGGRTSTSVLIGALVNRSPFPVEIEVLFTDGTRARRTLAPGETVDLALLSASDRPVVNRVLVTPGQGAAAGATCPPVRPEMTSEDRPPADLVVDVQYRCPSP
ncbi:MAG TPA: hypothetical protein VD962_12710 [Rubricoccaceae bacterium]|nr:hypothetical protein [Rubricoccaceae bacterium]